MKISKLIIGSAISLLAFSGVSNADVHIVSRANCFPPGEVDIGNESISWDPYLNSHWLRVQSKHSMGGRERHTRTTGWEYTWNNNYTAHRDTVSQRLWRVDGKHEGWNSEKRKSFMIGETTASSCNF